MNLGEVGLGDEDWIGLAQDRNRWRALVNWVLNIRVPWNAGILSSGLSSSAQRQRHKYNVSFCVWVRTDRAHHETNIGCKKVAKSFSIVFWFTVLSSSTVTTAFQNSKEGCEMQNRIYFDIELGVLSLELPYQGFYIILAIPFLVSDIHFSLIDP
jgi:hypothetical protein